MSRSASILVAIHAALIIALAALWLRARTEVARLSQDLVRSRTHPVNQRADRVAQGSDSRTAPLLTDSEPDSNAPGTSTLESENATPWSADDPIGIIIHGRVVDDLGHAVDAASVCVEDSVGVWLSGETAKPGAFVIHGLHPGTWSLSVTAAAFAKFQSDITLPASSTRYRHDVRLQRSTIVFVKLQTLEGASLREALSNRGPDLWDIRVGAVATAQPPGSRLGANRGSVRCLDSLRDDSGDLRRRGIGVPGECDGYLDVGRAPPFCVSAVFQDAVLQTKEVKAPEEVVVFSIDPAVIEPMLTTVRVRVLDAVSRAPLSDASVEVSKSRSFGRGESPDGEGRLVFQNRQPGWLVLRAEAAGHERLELGFRASPGEVVDLGEVALEPSTKIEGQLLTPEGRPIGGEVRFVRLDRLVPSQRWDRTFHLAGVDGRFAINWAGRGRYLLLGQDDSNAYAVTPLVVDTSPGDVKGAQLRLARGVGVTFAIEVAAPERVVQLRDSGGTLLYSEVEYGDGFSLRLAPGAYALTMFDGAQEVKSQSVVVGSSAFRVRMAE